MLVSDIDAAGWRFKRDPRIALPAGEFGVVSSACIPFLRPEIVLLYKANRMAARDQQDFDAVAPCLGAAPGGWLGASLELVHPNHPWRTALPV